MNVHDPQVKYPIHAAIVNPEISERSVLRLLREAYKQDPASLGEVDDEGHTPLALATLTANLPVITALVSMAHMEIAQGDDILGLHVADRSQETPASHNLRILRENPRFLIYDLLETSTKELTDAYIKNRLPPCLCGKCEAGWFSRRMRFRLRETANQIQEQMRLNLSNFTDGEPLDGEVILSDPALLFLPVTILERGIHKLFYIGYRAVFQTIQDILSRSGPEGLPTIQRLRVALADGARDGQYDLGAVQYFAQKGGSVTYALDYVIHKALWESPTPLGDGSFDKRWDDTSSSALATLMSPVPSDLRENPRRRSRSNSLRDALRPFTGRRSSVDSKRNPSVDSPRVGLSVEEREELHRMKLKDEWDASGDPGCPLDTQFGGARYMLGLHEEARWEIALDDVDPRGKRPSCELRRV